MKTLLANLPALPEVKLSTAVRSFIWFMAGSAVAWVGWLNEGYIGFIAIIMLLWSLIGSRSAAAALMMGYYLTGSSSAYGSFAAFFGGGMLPTIVGISAWIGVSILISAPWVIFKLPVHQRWGAPPIGMLGAIATSTLPPIGMVSWLNPIFAAGGLFPAWGLWGLLAFLVTVLAIDWGISRLERSRAYWVTAGLAMLVLAVCKIVWSPLQEPKPYFHAVQTELGQFHGGSPISSALREEQLLTIWMQSVEKSGPGVYFFPESVTGPLTPAVKRFWETEGVDFAKASNSVAILGTDVQVTASTYANMLYAVAGAGVKPLVESRQVAPPSILSTPTASRWAGFTPWFYSNTVQEFDERISFLICWEELMLLPMVSATVRGQPTMIVATYNHWFTKGTGASDVQRRHTEAWAKLLGVPLLRAGNY